MPAQFLTLGPSPRGARTAPVPGRPRSGGGPCFGGGVPARIGGDPQAPSSPARAGDGAAARRCPELPARGPRRRLRAEHGHGVGRTHEPGDPQHYGDPLRPVGAPRRDRGRAAQKVVPTPQSTQGTPGAASQRHVGRAPPPPARPLAPGRPLGPGPRAGTKSAPRGEAGAARRGGGGIGGAPRALGRPLLGLTCLGPFPRRGLHKGRSTLRGPRVHGKYRDDRGVVGPRDGTRRGPFAVCLGRGAQPPPLMPAVSPLPHLLGGPLCVWLSPHHLRLSTPLCSRFPTPPPHLVFKSPPGRGATPRSPVPWRASGDTQCPSPAEGPQWGRGGGGGSPLFEQRACAGEGGGGAWVGRAPEGLSKRAGAPRRPQRRARARIGEL